MKSFVSRKTLLQVLFWSTLWVLLPLLLSGNWELSERASVRATVLFFGVAIVVLINLEVLLPRFYFKKQQLIYLLLSFLLVALVLYIIEWDLSPWAEHFKPRGKHRSLSGRNSSMWKTMRFINTSMPYVTAWIGSSLIAIAAFANRKEKEMIQLQNEKLAAEMKFLKSQTNPHFLFNALNNIYTLTVIKSDAASENLLKLSDMLRYMLYDCKAEKVPLAKELDYIRNYIDLKLLKDSEGLNVKVHLDESRPGQMIAPLIFIPFIENAFKHSKIEDLENGWIDITLDLEGSNLAFKVKNSLPKQKYTKDAVGGIGLENVKRQLELLYPDQHQLHINTDDQIFAIQLKINL
ncbi:MAG: histidine kinase [Bacteroidota bacterium]